MAQQYQPSLIDIAYAARSGAAGQARRENAKLALDVAARQQAQQTHVDALEQRAADQTADRQATLLDRQQARNADQALAQQRTEAAQLGDERDHQQAEELQQGRQDFSWDSNRAEAINKGIGTVQKHLASSQFQGQCEVTAAVNFS